MPQLRRRGLQLVRARTVRGREKIAILTDPKALNYLLLLIYGCNAVRWAAAGSWPDSLYWAGALAITVAITWGFAR